MTGFTDKGALKAYLKRKRGTFNRPLVHRIQDGHEPVMMTVSRVLAGGPDAGSKRHRVTLRSSACRGSAHFTPQVTPVTPEH